MPGADATECDGRREYGPVAARVSASGPQTSLVGLGPTPQLLHPSVGHRFTVLSCLGPAAQYGPASARACDIVAWPVAFHRMASRLLINENEFLLHATKLARAARCLTYTC